MIYTEEQKKELRIELAKDVINQLNLDIYTAENNYGFIELPSDITTLDNISMCELLKMSESCEVCAIGSLLISYLSKKDCDVGESLHILKYNTYFNSVMNYSFHTYNILSNIFDIQQLKLIEFTFEQYDIYAKDLSDDDINAAIRFAECYLIDDDEYDLKQLMIDIMENIIANNGIFVPQLHNIYN